MRRSGLGIAALALVLAGCGDDSSGAPTDASKDDFCRQYTEASYEALEGVDPEATEKERAQQIVDAFKDWAKEMREVGTPEDMPDDARAAFEDGLEEIEDLDADDLDQAEPEDLQDELQGDDADEARALSEYVAEHCDFEVPGLGEPSP